MTRSKFPTSSKMGNTCLASFPNADSVRSKDVKSHAAEIGDKIHEAICKGFLAPVNGFSSVAAARKAEELGVLGEYMSMSLGPVLVASMMKAGMYTMIAEHPVCVSSDGKDVRFFSKYEDRATSVDWLFGGTVDLAIIKDDIVHVFDWKTGWESVDYVDMNHQLKSLGHAIGSFFGAKRCIPYIGYLRTGVIEIGQEFDVDIMKYIEEFKDGTKEREANAYNCRYCANRPSCGEYYKFSSELVKQLKF